MRKFAIFTLNRHLYEQEDEAEEGQTMTMKEIEEQKRKEKELQQKKVCIILVPGSKCVKVSSPRMTSPLFAACSAFLPSPLWLLFLR